MSVALMTIHGFLTDTEDFGRLYDYVGWYDEVVACKIPGHDGKVDFSKFTVQATLRAVLRTFDKLAEKHDAVDIVGFSMGGALATYVCSKRKVRKAVLVAPANKYFNFNSPLATLKFYIGKFKNAFFQRGSVAHRLNQTGKALEPHLYNASVSMDIALKRMLPNISVHTFQVFAALIKTINHQIETHKVSTPCLLIWGQLDELVPEASIDYLRHLLPTNLYIKHHDIGHAMLLGSKDHIVITDIVEYLSNKKLAKPIPKKQIASKPN